MSEYIYIYIYIHIQVYKVSHGTAYDRIQLGTNEPPLSLAQRLIQVELSTHCLKAHNANSDRPQTSDNHSTVFVDERQSRNLYLYIYIY